MTRGELLLYHIRKALAADTDFNVVKTRVDDLEPERIEAYAYIIKDTLQFGTNDLVTENGGAATGIRFVDVGILVRWKNTKDTSREGKGAMMASTITSKVEAAVYDYQQTWDDATVEDGNFSHKPVAMTITESTGYLDDERQLGEVAIICTTTVLTWRT